MRDSFQASWKFEMTPEAAAIWDAWTTAGDLHAEAERRRCVEASRLSGLEIVYDLSMFGDLWSPVYLWPNVAPVAWVDVSTGRRKPGGDYPSEPLR